MSATVAAYQDVLKEVWTQDRLEEQLYQENPFLNRLEKTAKYMIGENARVPLHKGRSGGYSVKPASGGALNAADEQKVGVAYYDLTHHYFQIELESAAVDQTDVKASSAAAVVETEVTGALNDLRKQITRQAFGNGDALIAQCTTSSGTTVINLLNTGFGFDAIERGWLYPGLLVDIGTTGSEATIIGDAEILDVSEDSTTPTITIGTAITTSSSHYVSVANARSGATSYEMNGLRNLVSQSASFGGLDPTSAGNGFWKAANVDTSTTTLDLNSMYTNSRKVWQKGGGEPNLLVTSGLNKQRLFNLIQMQVHYASGNGMDPGDPTTVRFAGQEVVADQDCPNKHAWWVNTKHLFIINSKKPHWQNEYTGGDILEWKQGYTSLVAGLIYRLNLGTNRRNAFSGMTALAA